MNNILSAMLRKYDCHTLQDYENAIKEIVQEVALLGLSRAKFFEHAAFYGGTSLRILYGLDRFSENLDFSLLEPNPRFFLNKYLDAIAEEIRAIGLHVNVTEKEKTIDSAIQSAFIKAGTLNNFIEIDVPQALTSSLHFKQQLKIKLEVDTNPPPDFRTEAKHLLQPIPFSILSYQLPDLFAGKIHAVLYRQWKTRVKGRDWYDLIWFIANNIPVGLTHLQSRLIQGQAWSPKKHLTEKDVLSILNEKIKNIDFEQARQDVLPFLRRQDATQIWSQDFFLEIVKKLRFD